jgi:hypothetical protein
VEGIGFILAQCRLGHQINGAKWGPSFENDVMVLSKENFCLHKGHKKSHLSEAVCKQTEANYLINLDWGGGYLSGTKDVKAETYYFAHAFCFVVDA